jgi:hypothetical protein
VTLALAVPYIEPNIDQKKKIEEQVNISILIQIDFFCFKFIFLGARLDLVVTLALAVPYIEPNIDKKKNREVNISKLIQIDFSHLTFIFLGAR